MTELIQLDVIKTLKNVPLEDVQEILIITRNSEKEIKVITTLETDEQAADLMDEALDMYYPNDIEIED